MANNRRPEATRGRFVATPLTVSRKQMFILSLSMPSAADLSRPFQRPPGNSRVAWLLLDSEVIQRVEIAESPVKRAFRGACPPSCILFWKRTAGPFLLWQFVTMGSP